MNDEPLGCILEVLVLPAVVPEFGLEVLVRPLLDPVLEGANVIQHRDDPRRTLVLNQLADDGVVEVVDRRPGNAFLNILLL